MPAVAWVLLQFLVVVVVQVVVPVVVSRGGDYKVDVVVVVTLVLLAVLMVDGWNCFPVFPGRWLQLFSFVSVFPRQTSLFYDKVVQSSLACVLLEYHRRPSRISICVSWFLTFVILQKIRQCY